MKKFLCFFMLVISLSAGAQYYNPYANQQAYEYGKRLAEQVQRQQQQQQQQAYNWGRALGMMQQGQQSLYDGDYDGAVDFFTEATELGYAPAYEALGLMYELGIGVPRDPDFAWDCYDDGASKGNYACKQALRRIRNSGYYSSSQKTQWLKNFRANYAANYGGGYSPSYNSGGSYNNNSVNSTSSGRTCPSCNGSGKGSDQIVYSPNYTGNQASVYCSQCGRTSSPHTHHRPNCPVCHGTGRVQ